MIMIEGVILFLYTFISMMKKVEYTEIKHHPLLDNNVLVDKRRKPNVKVLFSHRMKQQKKFRKS